MSSRLRFFLYTLIQFGPQTSARGTASLRPSPGASLSRQASSGRAARTSVPVSSLTIIPSASPRLAFSPAVKKRIIEIKREQRTRGPAAAGEARRSRVVCQRGSRPGAAEQVERRVHGVVTGAELPVSRGGASKKLPWGPTLPVHAE